MATCNIACRVSAYAQLPKARRRKKAAEEPHPHGHADDAEQGRPHPAEAVEEGAARQLKQVLKRKHRAVVKVHVGVSAANGGPATTYTRKAKVKRRSRSAASRVTQLRGRS